MNERILNIHSIETPGHRWLENLKLPIAPGQWTAILGRSGVGKSTLLQLICQLLPLELNRPTLKISARWEPSWDGNLQPQATLMSQQHAMLPWGNALDNVLIGARLRARIQTKDRDRALAFLDQLGLKEKVLTPIDQLSGGMQQRVSLARVLFEDRSIVCLDEPFSALDAVTKAELYPIVKTHLEGRTVIQVTHDPWEALQLADEIYVLAGNPVKMAWHWSKRAQALESLSGEEKISLVNQIIETMRLS